MITDDVSSIDYWDERYKAQKTGWDIGAPTPIFTSWLAENPGAGQRVCVLGAGSGYDAIEFAKHGYQVTAVDFAPIAMARIRAGAEAASVDIDVVAGDLFALADTYAQAFDLVVEYTTYCAIDPGRRGEYVEVVSKLLEPGSRLLALFFPVNKKSDSGPPFRVTAVDVEERFSEYFSLESQFVPANSVEGRQGREILAVYRRK